VSGNPFGCGKCEELLQQYVDRDLDADEMGEVEVHLARCRHCSGAYKLEENLHQLVRFVADQQRMDPELKQRLLALRTPLV
jgi:anti-sigma factor (TIGR02949 family)